MSQYQMMLPVLVFLLLALLNACEAHGHGHGGGRGGAGPCDSWLGYSDDDWRARWPIDSHMCRCSTGRYRSQNICAGRTGLTKLGCPVSNRFVQCSGETCSVETCPTTQVWNFTLNACAQCATGMHIDTRGRQRCVCDRGTRSDRVTRKCVACPSGAVVEEDRCYCPGTLAFNRKNNTCSTCPVGTTLASLFGGCYCTDRKMFWNADAWACQPCPGTWEVTSKRGILGRFFSWTQETCTCKGTNQIFDSRNVTCYTCPTTAVALDGRCRCTNGLEVFDSMTKTCVCDRGLMKNAAGACVVNATEAAPTGPINP